jgi:hypothetical protein
MAPDTFTPVLSGLSGLFGSFGWFTGPTHQTDQIDQINKMDQTNQIDQPRLASRVKETTVAATALFFAYSLPGEQRKRIR